MKIGKLFVFVFALLLLFGMKTANASVDYNCYCLNGSAVPFYYPENKKLNTSDFDSCHQECANLGAKYFSFSTVAHVGTTAVTKSAVMPSATNSNVASGGAIQNNIVPGTTTEESRIIKCGRPGQNMCTLCDLIAGMNNIIQYLMKIAIVVALLAVTIGGVMYVVSATDTGLADMAKKTITNAAVGFVIIFAAFLIIDTTIAYLGTKQGMGINVISWGQFVCAPGVH